MSVDDVNGGADATPQPSEARITLTVVGVSFTPYALARMSNAFFLSSEA